MRTRKISKADARYQSSPKGTRRCRGCSMFVKPDGCTLVMGEISPHGYCQYWEKKS